LPRKTCPTKCLCTNRLTLIWFGIHCHCRLPRDDATRACFRPPARPPTIAEVKILADTPFPFPYMQLSAFVLYCYVLIAPMVIYIVCPNFLGACFIVVGSTLLLGSLATASAEIEGALPPPPPPPRSPRRVNPVCGAPRRRGGHARSQNAARYGTESNVHGTE